MRILGVFPSYRPREFRGSIGGGEISNRLLLEGLARKGHEVIVVTFNAGGFGEYIENGVRVIELSFNGVTGSSLWSRLAFRYRAVRRFRGDSASDIILTTTEALGTALALREAVGVPLGLLVRAYENFEGQKTLPGVAKRLFKRFALGDFGRDAVGKVDLLLPNSEFMANYCSERLKVEARSVVVYPPVEYTIQESTLRGKVRTVSMVGTSLKKGTELVRELAAGFPELTFRIVGYPGLGADEVIQSGNLVLVGWCDVGEEFRNIADLVLVPSLWEEPFGRVAVEAVAAGKLVLVSNTGGLPEAVGHEEDLMVDAGDYDAWRARLEAVLAAPTPFWDAVDRVRTTLDCFEANVQIGALERAMLGLLSGQSTR